jgi:hypothetical protein
VRILAQRQVSQAVTAVVLVVVYSSHGCIAETDMAVGRLKAPVETQLAMLSRIVLALDSVAASVQTDCSAWRACKKPSYTQLRRNILQLDVVKREQTVGGSRPSCHVRCLDRPACRQSARAE